MDLILILFFFCFFSSGVEKVLRSMMANAKSAVVSDSSWNGFVKGQIVGKETIWSESAIVQCEISLILLAMLR